MKLQAINAQPLRQAVSFGDTKAQTAPAVEGKKMSTKAIAGWTVAGAAAIGAIWWAVSSAKKGKASEIVQSDMFKTAKSKFDEAAKLIKETTIKEGETSAEVAGGKLVKIAGEDGVVTFQKMVGENKDQKAFEFIVKKADEKTETIFKDFLKIVEKDGKKVETYEKEAQSTFVQITGKESKLVSEEITVGAKKELYIADEKGEKIAGKFVVENGEIKETAGEFEGSMKDGKLEYKAKEAEAKTEAPKTDKKEEKPAEKPADKKADEKKADAPKAEEKPAEKPADKKAEADKPAEKPAEAKTEAEKPAEAKVEDKKPEEKK